ncbi:Meiotically up-regulated 75 [Hyphodiscus hymeniophilus]|uniref:Meiotically up-regulated 75 n=1 Tax=Hyphodiscus hymeniophilus TaxID=353542 RepID=A0A9P6VSB3_9HELO|nr:Meiotically up-regulated 75 [Hyphodiscus hymeniophilus]
MCSTDIFLGLLAIIFPPIAVWVKCGVCSADSLINICLCMLGFIPGLLHAWYIIAKFPETDYDQLPQDAESGRVTYVIVQSADGSQRRVPKNSIRPAQAGYGTTASMAPPVHQDQNGTWSNGGSGSGEGSSRGAVPPTYAEAVKGDNKVQSRD